MGVRPLGRTPFLPRSEAKRLETSEVYPQPGDGTLQEIFLLLIGWVTVSPFKGDRFTVDNREEGGPFHRE